VKNKGSYIFIPIAVLSLLLVFSMYPRFSYYPDFAQKKDIPGVGNFARLAPGIWRGQAPDEAGLETLKEMGVKTIIDFRTSDEHEALEGDGQVEYVRMSFSATDPPPAEFVDKFLEIVTEPARQPVFFHCRHGKDRTGTMAALYRIRVQGWEPEKAFNEMKYFGFRTFYRDLAEFVLSQKPITNK